MKIDKESKSEKKKHFFFWGGGGGGADTKTVCQTVSFEVKYKKCNYLHNVEHMVQSTFRNMLITF